jgi:hypothetical protein
MIYSISFNIRRSKDMIISIRAKMGNRLRNCGRQFMKRFSRAAIRAMGFGMAQRTSIIQIMRWRIGRKNLYNMRNGINCFNKSIIASKIFLAKLGFNAGMSLPGGIRKLRRSRRYNRSSGMPAGSGIFGITGKVLLSPNPGISGPLGPVGDGKLIGLHGIIRSHLSYHLYRAFEMSEHLFDLFSYYV